MRNDTFNILSALLYVRLNSFADAATAATEGGGAAATPKPQTAVQAHRTVSNPVAEVDLSKLSVDELREFATKLQAKQARAAERESTKLIRFNDGSDPNIYEAGQKMLDGKIAKGGEVKSARDSGTISVYGFGRQPISMFPNHLISFAGWLLDSVLPFIASNEEAINAYAKTKPNYKASMLVNRAELDSIVERWNAVEVVPDEGDETTES